jgi:hypothetical protein
VPQHEQHNVRVTGDMVGRFAKGDVVDAQAGFGDDVYRLAELGVVQWTDDEVTVKAETFSTTAPPTLQQIAEQKAKLAEMERAVQASEQRRSEGVQRMRAAQHAAPKADEKGGIPPHSAGHGAQKPPGSGQFVEKEQDEDDGGEAARKRRK